MLATRTIPAMMMMWVAVMVSCLPTSLAPARKGQHRVQLLVQAE